MGLDDVGVYLSDSVDGVRSHDAQVRHVHPLASVLFNQRHLPQLVHVVWIHGCNPLRRQNRRTFRTCQGRVQSIRNMNYSTHIQVDLVDLVDDLQVSGQEVLQQLHRPALQSLREDCVVGVGERSPGEVPGLQRGGRLFFL